MRFTTLHWLIVTTLQLTRPASAQTQPSHDFFVAPEGKDSWSGNLREPNATGTDGPLASLAGARDAVRKWKQAGASSSPVTVQLAGGTYYQHTPVWFEQRDSGSATAPIVYRAASNATVRINGGIPVTGWERVSDPSVRRRLTAAARDKVQVTDLRALGITNYGQLGLRGFGMGSPMAEAELFFNDRPMTLARWPNEGFRGLKAVIDPQLVQVDTERVARWTEEADPWVFAYWHHDWAELYEPITEVLPDRQALRRSAEVKPRYGITAERARWYAFNLLSELDQPGEYYLDREAGRLYFWPPESGGRTALSLAEGFIRANELSHVTFSGLTFQACRGGAIAFKDGAQCRVLGCTIRNTGKEAVRMDGGTKHEVFGCDVYFTGEGGISMVGGDRRTLTPARHNAENNHVHHYARRARTYKSAISVSGVGNRIAHNLIHDGPHMALSAGGNDHVVEFNEIHNVVEESGDAGAYYVGRDWTQRGNALRYNYWHHIAGGTGYGGMTIYLDDQHCSHTIYGNLFERCSQAVFIGGGDDNVVTNNVFLDCWRAAHLDNRGMGWQKAATDDPNGELRTRLRAMPYQNELWCARYPGLVSVLDDDPNIPKRNIFARNISAGGQWDHLTAAIRQYQTVEDNLVFDNQKDWVRVIKDSSGRPVRLEYKNLEAVNRIGFVPLPLEQMGLYDDERRASWPVAHTVHPVRLSEDPRP